MSFISVQYRRNVFWIFLEPEGDSGYNRLMKKVCATCGGTGQIRYFQGESRFLLTWEECPHCSGTGMSETPVAGQEKKTRSGTGARKKSGGKRQN